MELKIRDQARSEAVPLSCCAFCAYAVQWTVVANSFRPEWHAFEVANLLEHCPEVNTVLLCIKPAGLNSTAQHIQARTAAKIACFTAQERFCLTSEVYCLCFHFLASPPSLELLQL